MSRHGDAMARSHHPHSLPASDLMRVTQVRGLAIAGMLGIVAFFGLFGSWAVTAPLMGAVIAAGSVVKDGNTLQIAHEIGGVVSRINVREGDKVNAGDVLVVMDDTELRAARDGLKFQLAGRQLIEARLNAERAGADRFDPVSVGRLKDNLSSLGEQVLTRLIDDQKRRFDARRERRMNENAVLRAQLMRLGEEKAGNDAEIAAVQGQLANLEEETAIRRGLVKKKLVRASDLRALERGQAQVERQLAELRTRQLTLPHEIDEAKNRLQNLDRRFMDDLTEEQSQTRLEIDSLQKKLETAESQMQRVELKAPSAGTVAKLHVNTIGSAVQPFSPLVEIVPEDEPAVAELRVDPRDIDNVRLGQDAELVFSAYSSRAVPPVAGSVIFVSPDRVVQQQDGLSYYTVRVRIADDADQTVPEILPGMPVEAYLKTQARTFADILLEPFTESLRRSFRG
ncbi:Type I secretion system membrane fusion protein PrsE [Hartmannibacter diazotrophicus]|uniref:Membrane fusion protein (MFP) family protein n=1 Tax=Hartmannibacter diazotrophicus TaxID=1482074 RepID=A0A2C9D5A7_9HYPH|nr:HlyD family type I secretion periplasmic adaptor subunit [Hartmannibacter diazotrophicus]SON55494.1 Type I secretion system membrane fusion protein PrsE [Hartmannibacter diazotrophicus]